MSPLCQGFEAAGVSRVHACLVIFIGVCCLELGHDLGVFPHRDRLSGVPRDSIRSKDVDVAGSRIWDHLRPQFPRPEVKTVRRDDMAGLGAH